MTRKQLRELIEESIEEMSLPDEVGKAILPPNTPARPISAGKETLAVSNFTTHKLEISVKLVSTGAIFVDIREV